jgi:hypothetical protein
VIPAGAEPYIHAQTGKPLVDWFTKDEYERYLDEVALESGGHVPVLIAEGSRGSFGGRIANLPDTHEDRVRWMLSAGL